MCSKRVVLARKMVCNGAPFNEEEWSDKDDEEEICAEGFQRSESIPISAVANNNTYTNVTSTFEYGTTSNLTLTESASAAQTVVEQHNIDCVCPSTAMSSGNDENPSVGEVNFDYLMAMIEDDEFPALLSELDLVNLVNGDEFIYMDDIFADLGDLTDWEELCRMLYRPIHFLSLF